MAADTRPYKSKEQDGQGNELIIRDQQLVEQDTTTTMPAGTCFQTLDVDGRPVKIPKANMVDIVREALGTLLNGLSDQTTVTKVPSLNGNTLGASTVATLASLLGGSMFSHHWVYALSEIENRVVGIYFSGDGDLQPFSWAVYLCLGVMQIALSTFGGSPHFAFRTYQSNQWSEWQIIVGS